MLVVVEDGNVAFLDQGLLDAEALRSLDVLQVDPSEGGTDRLDDGHELVGILLVDLDVVDVDVGKSLEEDALALHHRLRRQGSTVTKTQDRSTVRDDGHKIALVRIVVGLLTVLLDLQHRLRDAGSIGV